MCPAWVLATVDRRHSKRLGQPLNGELEVGHSDDDVVDPSVWLGGGSHVGTPSGTQTGD